MSQFRQWNGAVNNKKRWLTTKSAKSAGNLVRLDAMLDFLDLGQLR